MSRRGTIVVETSDDQTRALALPLAFVSTLAGAAARGAKLSRFRLDDETARRFRRRNLGLWVFVHRAAWANGTNPDGRLRAAWHFGTQHRPSKGGHAQHHRHV